MLYPAQKLNPAISQYRDRRFNGTQEEFEDCLRKSTTLYVGNLSFYTTEEQIFEVCLSSAAVHTHIYSQSNRLTLSRDLRSNMLCCCRAASLHSLLNALLSSHRMTCTAKGKCISLHRCFPEQEMSSASSWGWTSTR